MRTTFVLRSLKSFWPQIWLITSHFVHNSRSCFPGSAQIHESKFGLTVYQKKAEFGSASIIATDLVMERVAVPYAVERGSRITVDGEAVEANYDRLDDILYGSVYGTAIQ